MGIQSRKSSKSGHLRPSTKRPWPVRFCRRYGYRTALAVSVVLLIMHATRNQFIVLVDVHNVNPVYKGDLVKESVVNEQQLSRNVRGIVPVLSDKRSGHETFKLSNGTTYAHERYIMLMEAIEELKKHTNIFQGNFTEGDIKGRTCKVFNTERTIQRVAVTNIWAEKNIYFEDDVTLVTQFTLEKFSTLNILMTHWPGPISATFYASHRDLDKVPTMLKWFPNILTRNNMDIHIVLKNGTMYPMNYLRNVAINNTVTPYMLLMDIDFMPSNGLYEYLMDFIPTMGGLHKECLVVPAMEYLIEAGLGYPQNKSELIHMTQLGLVVTSEKIHWPPSHRATNYSYWFNSTKPFKTVYEDGYEPYVVVRKEGLPLYNETFLGGFRDKITHLFVLNATGYSFTVLSDHFAVHIPHIRETRPNYYRCIIQPYQDLKAMYGITPDTVAQPAVVVGPKKRKRRVIRIIRRVQKNKGRRKI